MGPSPILSIIDTVTIDPMLNFNGGNNGHGLKILYVNRPSDSTRCVSIGQMRKLDADVDVNAQCVWSMMISTLPFQPFSVG